ncbi:hypothetical protein LX36DRAFT_193525 [Colletotrichum falcatum]|nr:hypothetical protein LX36DRAFT_193525 [Colletotrichum falcatum]
MGRNLAPPVGTNTTEPMFLFYRAAGDRRFSKILADNHPISPKTSSQRLALWAKVSVLGRYGGEKRIAEKSNRSVGRAPPSAIHGGLSAQSPVTSGNCSDPSGNVAKVGSGVWAPESQSISRCPKTDLNMKTYARFVFAYPTSRVYFSLSIQSSSSTRTPYFKVLVC